MTKRLYAAYERRVNVSLRLDQALKAISDLGFELQLEDKEIAFSLSLAANNLQSIVHTYKARTSSVLDNIREEIEKNVCETQYQASDSKALRTE